EIRTTLGGSGAGEPLVQAILQAFAEPGRTVAESFNEAMAAVLERFGMVLADAANPALKKLSRPVLRGALEEAVALEAALIRRNRAIAEAGYSTQVVVLEGGTNVFREGERGRERLDRAEGGFALRERRRTLESEAVFSELEATPEVYSPNVLLRPVVESAVFPTIAYIGGPGEIAYFAQTAALFKAFGRTPPVVVPRFSGLVVEPAVERALSALQLSIPDTAEPRDLLMERLARGAMPEGAAQTLTGMREEIVSRFDELADRVEEIDSTLVGALAAERDRLLLGATRAERRIVRALKRSDRVAADRLDRVLNSLRPEGQPQDRVLNVLTYLVRYGEHFLDETRLAMDQHWSLPTEE
ncbi:MAG: bacillithiol biosynthesis cysteine-adding enzyme BshC, partial [Gemmatimonadota bacterium]|nr:bacillithiol biosynthesis cysteine-adding enzyme BshC [Gemmatimonadota bacterium]